MPKYTLKAGKTALKWPKFAIDIEGKSIQEAAERLDVGIWIFM